MIPRHCGGCEPDPLFFAAKSPSILRRDERQYDLAARLKGSSITVLHVSEANRSIHRSDVTCQLIFLCISRGHTCPPRNFVSLTIFTRHPASPPTSSSLRIRSLTATQAHLLSLATPPALPAAQLPSPANLLAVPHLDTLLNEAEQSPAAAAARSERAAEMVNIFCRRDGAIVCWH